MTKTKRTKRNTRPEVNRLRPEDRPVHDWYRFILSFPPHFVRSYLDRFGLSSQSRVLDPFCGTGTTVVECKKQGVAGIGIEAHPMACFASSVKVDWTPDPDLLTRYATQVADRASDQLARDGIPDDAHSLFSARSRSRRAVTETLRTLSPEQSQLLLANSISPLPLHKTLVLRDCITETADERYRRHALLALAKAAVNSASNLHFGPEVGVTAPKQDAPVIDPWLAQMETMADDLRQRQDCHDAPSQVHHADSRTVIEDIASESIDAVITSPPYPNEKDYTRTTRLESVLLNFISDRQTLRGLKQGLVRSNTRGVYRGDDDDGWVREHPEIQQIADAIEKRRLELGKTSGFERMYHRVTRLYFGGMARHFAELRRVLRPGARLAYVVGDQASYLQVMIRTGKLLGEIAESLGYETLDLELFRTRMATATKRQLREEVLLLQWPGN